MNQEIEIDIEKLRKIVTEIKQAIKPVLEKSEYGIPEIGVGLNQILASFAVSTFDIEDIEKQKEIARELGRALESQIMTNYTGDPDYRTER